MKNYWILARVMLRNMFASMNPFASDYANDKKKTRAAMRVLGVAVLMLMGVGFVIYLEYAIFGALKSAGMPIMLPGMAILVSMAFTLVLGLFQTLSELYQGKDASFLAVLPLTSRSVFTARLTTLYVSELGIDALICVPAFVMYGISVGSAWPVALTGLPVLLFLPMIPMSIVALLSSLLMRISAFSRHRETIVMVLSFVLAIAYSLTITLNNASDNSPAQAVTALMMQEALVDRLLNLFPPVMWAVKGLSGEWLLMLLYLAVSVGCCAGVILLAGPGYLEQALSTSEKTVVHRKVRGALNWKRNSRLAALHALEWKQLLRTPAWSYNALAGVVMFPLMMGVGLFAGFSKSGEGMSAMRDIVREAPAGYVALVVTGILMFGSMVNPAVSTAISREGGCWPFALTLPVRQKIRFTAKLLVGMEINAVVTLLIGAVIWFMSRMNLLWMLAALAVSMLVSLAAAAFSLWVDAMRPRLEWANEMEAIKKNFNQVFGMLLWVVLVGLCVIPAVLLWDRGGGIALLAVAGVALVECAAGLLLLYRMSEKHAVLQV